MIWCEFHNRDAAEAHARMSVALPVSFHSPLKIAAPIEDDPPPKRDDYVPAWARRSVWDV